jgi:hypothetical protein
MRMVIDLKLVAVLTTNPLYSETMQREGNREWTRRVANASKDSNGTNRPDSMRQISGGHRETRETHEKGGLPANGANVRESDSPQKH